MKKILAFFLLSLMVLSLSAQVPSTLVWTEPPDIISPQTAASLSLIAYKSDIENKLRNLYASGQGNTTDIGTIFGQINALQAQVNSQAQSISTMQAQIAKLLAPSPTLITLTWSSLPDGPLNGLYQGVNFGTGWWCIANGELKACFDGQPQRAIVFNPPVKIVSFTFSTTSSTTTGIILTAQAGQQAASTAAINQDSTFTPGWITAIPAFTVSVSPSTGHGPDLRIRQIQYQQ